MDIYKIIFVALLTGFTSLAAHTAKAVFHDGIRPILPELTEGRMKRSEASSIAFGLSVGFIASIGIAFTVTTGLLNPWLLFLPTDIIGVASPKKSISFALGALWGILVVTSLQFLNTALTSLPVDFLGALGEIGTPVIAAFALFPILAIFYQFKWKKGLIAAVLVLLTRVLIVKYTKLYPESIEMFVGIVLLLLFAIIEDTKNRGNAKTEADDDEESIFEQRTKRIFKNLPLLAVIGALIAIIANLGYFAGSEVSIYPLAEAAKATDPIVAKSLIHQAALGDLLRGLGFVPLIATTALATGVYGVVGLTFIFPVGYLAPNWIVAGILGALVIILEVSLLRAIGKFLEHFPSIRHASDNIRTAMENLMDLSLLVGSIFAVIKMGGYTGFFIFVVIYFLNEVLGRKIIKMAIGPLGAIVTGIILNLLYFAHLFVPIAAK
ncbi:MAG: YhfT family protein [Sebaldella sp.]|nr:YhfT family protein [Sebaldella sp.]